VTYGTWSGDEDELGKLVPLYVLVGGRTAPRNTRLDLATQIIAYPSDTAALEPQYRQIVLSCGDWISIAEVSAGLGRPLTVVKILVDVLLEQGLLAIGAPAQQTVVSRGLLETLLDGLQRL
jgi:uncharacterized protein DUF742